MPQAYQQNAANRQRFGNGRRPATPRTVDFLVDLLDNRDLLASPRFFDRVNAMDAEELAAYIERLKEQARTLSQHTAGEWIERLKPLPRKARPDANRGRSNYEVAVPSEQLLPAGRYAVDSAEGELRFYRIYRKRNGRVDVYVQHGPTESKVPWGRAVQAIFEQILTAPGGARAAAHRYGHEIGACSVCGIRLTNKLSRELGIGPVCGGRFYEERSEWNAVRAEARQAIIDRGEDPDAVGEDL